MLRLGTDLLRFRSLITAAEQVKEVAGPRLGPRAEEGVRGDRPGQDDQRRAARPINPVDIAKKFGDPVYVASDVAYRTQAEVDGAAAAIAEQIAGAFAEFEGVARGNPKLQRRRRDLGRQCRRAVRRQVHHHHLAPPVRPDDRLHHVVLGHRAAGTQPVRAGHRRRRRPSSGRAR